MFDEGFRVGRVICTRETDKAILVVFDDDDRQLWVPKSQVHDDSEVYEADDEGDLVVTSWFAKKEGFRAE